MVIEALIILLTLIVLAAVVKTIFALPWYLAIPSVVVLLILYDGIVKDKVR
ncbi:MAG: hypothetical protein QW561_02505 [Candidatus Aenigmatarchaeota archaeon]